MSRPAFLPQSAALLVCAAALLGSTSAQATTQLVTFNVLNASATLPVPLLSGDALHVNTYVATETGALTQTVNFTLASGITSLGGQAVWEVGTAAGPGPRLTGVNIDLFDASNVLVTSDTFAGVLGNFAVSTFASGIGPGNYRLVITGTGVRESSLDLTLTFAGVVPEPGTYGLMLAGLGLVGLIARRRRG